jgi:hypothetical protein
MSPLGRRLISLGVHNVALSFTGVNGREERRLVEELIDQFPESWPGEWLRLRARTLKDDRLKGWADYYEQVCSDFERSYQCVAV